MELPTILFQIHTVNGFGIVKHTELALSLFGEVALHGAEHLDIQAVFIDTAEVYQLITELLVIDASVFKGQHQHVVHAL